jgi:hypothetical protein
MIMRACLNSMGRVERELSILRREGLTMSISTFAAYKYVNFSGVGVTRPRLPKQGVSSVSV